MSVFLKDQSRVVFMENAGSHRAAQLRHGQLLYRTGGWIPGLAVAMVFMAAMAAMAQTNGLTVRGNFAVRTNAIIPQLPVLQSPVDYFRQLLMMSPAERMHALAGRAPASRAKIIAKIHEYQVLSPNERELRLRATELRWYLTPMMRNPVDQRNFLLARMPAELRDIAKARLAQWDLLSPSLQHELLAHDNTLHYFAAPTTPPVTNAQAEAVARQFSQFFDLTPNEKTQLLGTLSEPERVNMEKTLKTFEKLPPRQRLLCIRNYARFADMNAADRADFLKNAESWAKMSPQERQTWRDLVAIVPILPPIPVPIPPHIHPKSPKPSMVTNEN